MRCVIVLIFLLVGCSTPPKDYDREIFYEVVKDNRMDIRDCYELALQKNDDLTGKLTVTWTVSTSGNARNITIKKADATIKSEELNICVIRKIRLWNFPKPPDDKEADVIFPFVLTREKGQTPSIE